VRWEAKADQNPCRLRENDLPEKKSILEATVGPRLVSLVLKKCLNIRRENGESQCGTVELTI
jgi:hypothetical protein